MEFQMIRGMEGSNQVKRCKKISGHGLSALYCDCGCQVPQEEDLHYNIEGVTVEYRDVDGYFDKYAIKLIRDGKIVGKVSYGHHYVLLDKVEYIGVQKESRLYQFLLQAKILLDAANKAEQTEVVNAGDTLEDSYASEKAMEEIVLKEQDNCHSNVGYCKKCHSYCFGDCES